MTAIHAQIKKNPALAPSITAAFDTSGRNSQIMEKIQKDLQNTLGLQISLNNLDWKSYLKQLTTDAPQIYRLGWLAPFRDPVIYLEIFTSGNPSNYSGWSSPVYDQLVSDVRRLPSGEAREAKVRQAEKMLVDDEAIVVPIFHYTQVTAVSKRVEGFRVNPFSVILFREITVK